MSKKGRLKKGEDKKKNKIKKFFFFFVSGIYH
jgi:hypothetical protein